MPLAAPHLAALHLADGPAMYFSGTIMTFALPMGAFIVITVVLFYLFRSEHSGPRLKYRTTAPFTSFGTREPGPVASSPVIANVTVTEAAQQAAADPETTFGEDTDTQDTDTQDTGAQSTGDTAAEPEER